MSRFYSIDEANERLAEVAPLLEHLAAQRLDLIRLRDRVVTVGSGGPGEADEGDEELRRLRLRMQGIIDQMQADVARIDALDIVLRDIETGLIDFPALVSGRQIWLCWRLGETTVDSWHDLTTGFTARQPLSELA
ncbi:MAG: DUF2203 domain-containing protein [Chloroflexota bacterium]